MSFYIHRNDRYNHDFLRVFLNARSLRAAVRELTLEQLNEAFAKLTDIVEERRTSEAVNQEKRSSSSTENRRNESSFSS